MPQHRHWHHQITKQAPVAEQRRACLFSALRASGRASVITATPPSTSVWMLEKLERMDSQASAAAELERRQESAAAAAAGAAAAAVVHPSRARPPDTKASLPSALIADIARRGCWGAGPEWRRGWGLPAARRQFLY